MPEFHFIVTLPDGSQQFIRIPGTEGMTYQDAYSQVLNSPAFVGASVNFVGDNRGEAARNNFDFTKDVTLTTDTGRASELRRALDLASLEPTSDALGGIGIDDPSRSRGIYANFMQSQGINPSGLGSSSAFARFAPAAALSRVGLNLSSQGLLEDAGGSFAPGGRGGSFQDVLAQQGLGGIRGASGDLFRTLVGLANANTASGVGGYINPSFFQGAGGGLTPQLNDILALGRAGAVERFGGIAAGGLPDNALIGERFAQDPNRPGGFVPFASSQLGLG